MEENTRTPQPEAPASGTLAPQAPPSAGQTPLFRLAPGDLTGQRRTRRQAVLTALLTARNLPRRWLLRAGWMALGLVLLGIALAAGWRCAFQGLPPAGWLYALPYLGIAFIAIGMETPLLARQLAGTVRGFAGAVLYPDHLHLEGADDPAGWPLDELTQVRRFRGWTVLVWQRDTRLLVLPVPDTVCPAGGDGLVTDLRKAAPRATFHVRPRPPRRWPGRLVLLPLLPVLLFTMLLLSFSSQGRQILSSFHSDSGSLVLLVYDRTTQTLWTPDAVALPHPATGEVSFRWQTDDCCAVTYRTTDDTLQVELLPGSLHTAQRLDPDPPTGSWRQFFLTTELDVALQWDEATQSYLLRDEGAETVYRRWEDFDGLGIALCDDRGIPQWTLTPTRAPRWNADGTSLDTTALILCPVSLQETGERTQLLPDDGSMPDTGNTPDAGSDTAAQPTPAPPPTFDDTLLDVCLNEGGLFFTWDGGATWRELPVNFAASGLTVATRLTDFSRQGDEWRMTVTQEPYGREDLVFRANAPDGPWGLRETVIF